MCFIVRLRLTAAVAAFVLCFVGSNELLSFNFLIHVRCGTECCFVFRWYIITFK